MTFYICSCGLLYRESKEDFNQYCKLKGHTLFEVSAELYRLFYDLKDDNLRLKETICKRNRDIAKLKDKLNKSTSGLRVF